MPQHPLGTWNVVPILLLLLACRVFDAVHAFHNVTIDDTDTISIDYEPPDSWEESPFDPLDAGGTHAFTNDTGATASFTFTGIAIYFYSPLFPFDTTTAVSLDGEEPTVLDLQDPNAVTVDNGRETALSEVVWSSTGLDNIQHTLVVSVAEGESSAVVDQLVYTVLDPGDNATTTATSFTSTTPFFTASSASSLLPVPSTNATSNLSTTTPTAKKGLSIALGLVCTIFGLLVLYALYWYWRRRQRQKLEEAEEREHAALSSGGMPLPTSGSFSASEMAEAGASSSTMGVGLGAYGSPSNSRPNGYHNASPSPSQRTWPRNGGPNIRGPPVPNRVGPASPTVVGVVGNGRTRTASRRLGSSPLATQSPLLGPAETGVAGNSKSGLKKPLSTIPEMRVREREERESATGTASSLGGGVDELGSFGYTVVSPSPRGTSSSREGVEEPWSEVDTGLGGEGGSRRSSRGASGSGNGSANGNGRGSVGKDSDEWTTFDSRAVRFS